MTIRLLDGSELTLGVSGDRYAPGEAFPGNVDGPYLDLRRFWAMPGLADCHAHLSVDSLADVEQAGEIEGMRSRAFAQLAQGVFVVLDKGWRSDNVLLLLLPEPPTSRPYLEAAGRIITGPHGYFSGFAVETDDAGLVEAVRASDTRGGWIKLVGDWPQRGRGPVISFGEEALAAAVEVAHSGGARVALHTMAPDTPGMAVRAGVDSIEHGLYMTSADLEQLTEQGGAWVPTVVNTEDVVASFASGSTGARVLGGGLENVRRVLPLAEELGTTILCGTDLGLPHGQVGREALRLHEYGLSEAATVTAAGPAAYRYLGRDFLAPGTDADLVLFDRDPRAEPAILSEPVLGMRSGRVIFDRLGVMALGQEG